MYNKITEELQSLIDIKFREWLKPFINFNAYPNEILLGVRVPNLRKLAKKYRNIDISDLCKLLQNNCHEKRMLALFIMVLRSKKEADLMCDIYLKNHKYINNWDLIDYTAPHIVAPNIDIEKFRELANSDFLWENRTAMVSTIYYIKKDDFSLAIELAEKFMNHPHHLMHKASGWMLREIGKRDEKTLIKFLEKHSKNMPAIMKSYATEHLKKQKN